MSDEKEVIATQGERIAYLLYLIYESLDIPQVDVVRLVAIRGAKLVVVVILNTGSREKAVASFPVLVRGRRPTMQQQHLHFRVVANSLGPDLELALMGPDPDHSHA